MPYDRSNPHSMVNRVMGQIRQVPIVGQQPVPSQPPRVIVPPTYDGVERHMWRGPGAEPVRRGAPVPLDDQLFLHPQMREYIPDGELEDPKKPFWFVGNCPPWNCPTYWSYPFEYRCCVCIDRWEQDIQLCIIPAPEMAMQTIKSLGWRVEPGGQMTTTDVFEVSMYESGAERIRLEDMIADINAVDPSKRCCLAGEARPIEVWQRNDRNHKLIFNVKARGQVQLDGTSNHYPGEPMRPGTDFCLTISGWTSPIRNNNDGAPRSTDLGTMDNIVVGNI